MVAIQLRKVNPADFHFLKSLLQNEELMLVGWGKVYSDEEVKGWIKKIQQQYSEYGYSYYIVENQRSELIGIGGVIRTKIEGTAFDELAYIIKKEFQGSGYGTIIAKEL
ncbi:MAG: GNAT family N-acetyltransferase, partial [Enterococcus sp.]